MRGILFICVTCCLFMASAGDSTTATKPPTTTAKSTTSVATINSTIVTSNATTPNVSTISTTSTTTSNVSTTPSNVTVTSNSTATTPTYTGNSTAVSTTSPNTQNSSSSNVTEPTSQPNVTTPSQDTTKTTASPSNNTTPPSTASPRTCANNPCGNVLCVELFNDYACRCPPGFIFLDSDLSCRQGDTFYGELKKNVADFKPETTSQEYTEIFKEVMNNFKDCFTGYEYLGTTILEMGLSSTKHVRSSEITIKVVNVFGTGSISQAKLDEAIAAYSAANNAFGSYSKQTICSSGFYCDAATTECTADSSGQSAVCTCKPDLYSSQPTVTTCRECAPECQSSNWKQCKYGDPGALPSCVCLPGRKLSKDGKCVACDFGYSGNECKDNYLLILVIVGAVLGVAVLSLLGAVIGVSLRSSKGKRGDRVELIDNETPTRNSPAPGSLFPRIQMRTDLGQVNQASNTYEDDEEEYRRSIPKRDYDENPWYEMARKDRNY